MLSQLIVCRFLLCGLSFNTEVFPVRALPSSGIIPLLQQFCNNKDKDEHGFPVHPNARYNYISCFLVCILVIKRLFTLYFYDNCRNNCRNSFALVVWKVLKYARSRPNPRWPPTIIRELMTSWPPTHHFYHRAPVVKVGA